MESKRIQELKEVCILPYFFHQGVFHGGIEAGKECDNGKLRPSDIPLPRPGNFDRISGNYLYAGPLWNHFGHIFADSLHRLWAYGDRYDAIVFNGVIGLRGVVTPAGLRSWKYPDYFEAVLSLMGINANIHIVRRPTVFENLVVPEPGCRLKDGIRPFYRRFLKRYQEGIEAAVANLDAPEKIYYSRTHLISTYGGIIGSSYCEKLLGENGFFVCQPEYLSIQQQFANVLKSRALVFDEGSSVHLTSILHSVPTKMYMLPRRKDISDYTSALEPRGGVTVLAERENILMFKDRQGAYQPNCASTYNDFEKVVNAMRENGLVLGGHDRKSFMRLKMEDFMAAESGRAGVFP